ncbi:hypothetical protein B0T21DRAFT_370036 [Apiosordaria backusii]|uniref:Uncharacterized protein n=1 Tax=Apiosordaria backusii TaxID=314023 RepID=A0AA40B779_9PEZI|nr:hypothetical protein B0T21DRAFT_370036 [Apiosordaria backusii]
MATGNSRTLDRINNLEYIGGICEAPRNACRRVGCWETTGGYLCVENGNAAVVACTDASRRLENIKNGCCPQLWDVGGRPVWSYLPGYVQCLGWVRELQSWGG